MNPPALASGVSAPEYNEWTDGWRIVLACALASGTGIVLLFFSFSLFVLPMAKELGISRGMIGSLQSLIISGALGSPIIGWLADRYGFRLVFSVCTVLVVAIELGMVRFATTLTELGIGIFLLGFVGVGTTALTTTRPVNAHFVSHRGKALGLVAAGVSITTILAPPPLQAVMEVYGWRGGIAALAALSLLIGIPAVQLLLPNRVAGPVVRAPAAAGKAPPSFLRERHFWLLAIAGVFVGAATSGFVSQLSPMIQSEGLDVATGALALSAFAVGQLIGRLGGGLLLDRFDPRLVAVTLILLPGSGFVLLLLTDQMQLAALVAAGMIGLLQGAELDINAYFVARRFGLARYSAIYGALLGLGWIGNAAGIIGVGLMHDRFGSYDLAQLLALAALAVGAVLISGVRLAPLTPSRADGKHP